MGKRRWNGSNLLGHPSPQRRRRRHQTACDEFDSNILHNVKQQSSLHAFFGVKTRPSPMEVRSRSRCTPTIVGTPPTPQAELQRCRPTPPTSTAHPPPSTPVIKTQRVRKKTQQLYLDCGQRDFGSRSVCATCGMLYVHGLVEDAIQHARICQDYIQGVPFAIPTSTLSSFWSTQDLSIHAIQSTSKRMVRLGTVPERLIVEVRPTDTANLRKKVLQVRRIVDQELGFVASSDAKPARRTTYLCIQNKRVVGMACVELIDQAYALIQTAQAYERSTVPVKAMLGIHQLWVHSKFRSRGIATNLIDAARAKMVFGLVVPVDQVAFSSPTQAGAEFARRYYQHRATTVDGTGATDCNSKPHPTSNRVLVYDCGS